MSGRVHQEDETKLKGTVTQAEKDRTVTGSVTANAGTNLNTSGLTKSHQETEDNTIASGGAREAPIALLYGYEPNEGAWKRVRLSEESPGHLFVASANPENLKATVTQLAKDRTITGTATVTQIPLSTQLGSEITLTNADEDYLLPAAEQAGRSILVIYNISDTMVYIGGNGVSTANGMPLASTKYMVIPASANVYAVCGSAGKKLRLLECK